MRLSLLSMLGLLFLVLGQQIFARPWHGLVPLHSTRADVEKIWGKPRPATDGMHVWTNDENHSFYSTKDGVVHVLFAGFTECAPSVTRETILWISLDPRGDLLFSDFGIDLSKFESYEPARPRNFGYKAYIDESDGYGILTLGEYVNQIYYQPTADDRKLCKDYFPNGKSIRFNIYVG
jgi:hypothetical protein